MYCLFAKLTHFNFLSVNLQITNIINVTCKIKIIRNEEHNAASTLKLPSLVSEDININIIKVLIRIWFRHSKITSKFIYINSK